MDVSGWLSGLDVSYAQGDHRTSVTLIDWPQIEQSGVEVVYIKLSEGSRIRDSSAHSHVDGATAAGISHIGGYHFARTSAPVQSNIDVFLERWHLIGGLEFAVLDFEDPNNLLPPDETADWALEWLFGVAHEIRSPTLFYTFAGYVSHFIPSPGLAAYPLILAHYGSNNGISPPTRTPPACPAPWNSYVGWQHTSVGHLPGYAGNLDLDVFAPAFLGSDSTDESEWAWLLTRR